MPTLTVEGRPLTWSEARTLALASLGGALEYYDFIIFVFLATVIGKLFFPPGLPDWLRQLQTFGIFAAGYLARPLGGIIMAHVGDLHGRKRMFTLSVFLMAVPTLLISLLPTYEAVGAAAPLLLLLMRVMQGAAIGGEAPGGWVFVAEHASQSRTGLAIGLLCSGLTGGVLLGALIATTLSLLATEDQIAHGYWRVPFLVGGIFGFAAMVLRRWLTETPVFKEMRTRFALSPEVPLRVVLREHRLAVLVSVASTWMLTAAIVVVILMTPSLLQTSFGLTPHETLIANLGGTAALTLSAVMVGALTDRFGVTRTAIPMLLLLVGGTYALYLGAAHQPQALIPLYLLAGAGAGVVTVTPLLMVRAFPPAVRFSGISFSYNVAYAVFGGLTPLLVSWLVQFDRLAPAHYTAGVAVVALLATLLASRVHSPVRLPQSQEGLELGALSD